MTQKKKRKKTNPTKQKRTNKQTKTHTTISFVLEPESHLISIKMTDFVFW